MTSKTNIIEIDGKRYEVKEVDAKPMIYIQNNEQRLFCQVSKLNYIFGVTDHHCNFYVTIEFLGLTKKWENHLITIAREKGFISGCTIKTAIDMDIMKSGKLRLIGLSKLVTEGRKSIVIYDNGRWVAETIPCKSLWEMMCDGTLMQRLNKPNTRDVGNLMTRDEMSQVKCEPGKYDIEQAKEIIKDLTIKINKDFRFLSITQDQAKLIREILNDYLK